MDWFNPFNHPGLIQSFNPDWIVKRSKGLIQSGRIEWIEFQSFNHCGPPSMYPIYCGVCINCLFYFLLHFPFKYYISIFKCLIELYSIYGCWYNVYNMLFFFLSLSLTFTFLCLETSKLFIDNKIYISTVLHRQVNWK